MAWDFWVIKFARLKMSSKAFCASWGEMLSPWAALLPVILTACKMLMIFLAMLCGVSLVMREFCVFSLRIMRESSCKSLILREFCEFICGFC